MIDPVYFREVRNIAPASPAEQGRVAKRSGGAEPSPARAVGFATGVSRARWETIMGGYQVPSHGSGDDGYDEEGYDESQRAEILEATRNGPTDGVVMTDLDPDIDGDDAEDENLDDLDMKDGEVGETDATVTMAEDDMDEDDAQDDFDAGVSGKDEDGLDTTDDADDVALKP
ncbi:hypothetical protein [Sphingomonas bacterium]|uniref:hypothetical protein n=1 Tax=Sphingomonas bacterium TaxID=1895847 RepID=UPI0034A027D4